MEQSRTRSLSDGRVVPVEDSVRGKRQVWVDRGPGRPDHGPDNQGPGSGENSSKQREKPEPSGVRHGGAGSSHKQMEVPCIGKRD